MSDKDPYFDKLPDQAANIGCSAFILSIAIVMVAAAIGFSGWLLQACMAS